MGVSSRVAARRMLRMQTRLAVRLRKEMQREFRARYNAVSAALLEDGITAGENAMNGHLDTLEAILKRHYERVADAVGAVTIDSLKGKGAWMHKDFEDEQFMQLMNEWLAGQGAQEIAGRIGGTTRRQIREYIQQGLIDGVGVDEIARSLRARFPRILGNALANPTVRAHIIARTETHNAAGFASDMAARAAQVPGLQREWLSAQDARVRGAKHNKDHALANGQTVGMDDPFMFTRVDGSQYLLMRPGDPNGPANGIIMCRCVVAYSPPEGE